jgi:hypothetical protein
MADQMVIDANVATKWFLKDETDVDVADGILAANSTNCCSSTRESEICYHSAPIILPNNGSAVSGWQNDGGRMVQS